MFRYFDITISPIVKNIVVETSAINIFNLVEPSKPLLSYTNKIKDKKHVYSSFYKDNNTAYKKKIIKFLVKKSHGFDNYKEFFKNIKQLSKKYRYFIKTDIVGAYYNVSLDTVYEIIEKNVDNLEIKNYLIRFFHFISTNYEIHKYLYITDYSEFIFRLLILDLVTDKKIIFRMDDILLYDNDREMLKKRIYKLSLELSAHPLYLNITKTYEIDVVYNSIYVFKCIVTTPKTQIDDKTKNIIQYHINNNKVINIYQMNNSLYEYFIFLKNNYIPKQSNKKHPYIKISCFTRINIFQKIIYYLYKKINKTRSNENEGLGFKPTTNVKHIDFIKRNSISEDNKICYLKKLNNFFAKK